MNKNNYTPIQIAFENQLDKTRELLILKGADINAKDLNYQITNIHFLSL